MKKALLTTLSVLPGGFAILAIWVLFVGCAALHGGYADIKYKRSDILLSGKTYHPERMVWTSAKADACRKRPDLCLAPYSQSYYGGAYGQYQAPLMEFEGGVWIQDWHRPERFSPNIPNSLRRKIPANIKKELAEIRIRLKGVSDAQNVFFKNLIRRSSK